LRKYYGAVRWGIEDIIGAAQENGVTLTEAQAAAWWEKNEREFRERVIAFGSEILEQMSLDMPSACRDDNCI